MAALDVLWLLFSLVVGGVSALLILTSGTGSAATAPALMGALGLYLVGGVFLVRGLLWVLAKIYRAIKPLPPGSPTPYAQLDKAVGGILVSGFVLTVTTFAWLALSD